MDQYPDFQEPEFIGDEAEADPRIRVLRILARMIARELLNVRRDDKNNNSTTKKDQWSKLTHD